VTALVLILRPSLYWPGPRAALWILVPVLGACLGSLLWLGALMKRFARPLIPSEQEIMERWQAEEQRFALLRERAANDHSTAVEYLEELRGLVDELEVIVAERLRLGAGWNGQNELNHFKDELAWAEKRVRQGAA
jgi:hypothetical protein